MQHLYYEYWNKFFHSTTADLQKSTPLVTNKGRFVEKYGDQYIYFFQDLATNKKIIAATDNSLKKINLAEDQIAQYDSQSIRSHPAFKNYKLAFYDIDYGLDKTEFSYVSPFKDLNIKPLNSDDHNILDLFYLDCSDDDKETLDLNLEQDTALGAFYQNKLVAVARYITIRETYIADITVVTGTTYRGKRYSTPLVSELVKLILSKNLCPKYRVQDTNMPSIKIAERLGFKPYFHLLTWEVI